jgi:hypothetical protein
LNFSQLDIYIKKKTTKFARTFPTFRSHRFLLLPRPPARAATASDPLGSMMERCKGGIAELFTGDLFNRTEESKLLWDC